MLGQFRLDQCVSKACDSAALRASFEQTLNITVKTIIKMLPVPKDGKKVAKALLRLFETSTQIACVGEASHSLGFPGVLCLCVLCLMVGLVVVFTVYDVYCRGPSFARIGDEALAHVQQGEAGNAPQNGMPSQPSSNVERVTRWFSASHNVDRLMSVIGGDFKALNGIRVLSMCWIIMGHTILMFVMPPVVNPTVEDRFLRSVPFAFVRGAEYSVDTFFFMSGFLATFALMNQLKLKGILSASQYVSMVFLRYLRLTPSYAVVLLFFWKVLPLVSSGPFWDETTIFSSDACDKHWWTNLLYVNNLVPFNATAQEMCMGWSWYLVRLCLPLRFLLVSDMLTVEYRRTTFSSSCSYRSLYPCIWSVALEAHACSCGDHVCSSSRSSLWQCRQRSTRRTCTATSSLSHSTGNLSTRRHGRGVRRTCSEPCCLCITTTVTDRLRLNVS